MTNSPASLEAGDFCQQFWATWQRRRPGNPLNECISCAGRRRGTWAIPKWRPGWQFSLVQEAGVSAPISHTSDCAWCDCCSTPVLSS